MEKHIGRCSACGRTFPVQQLKELPEVEEHQRAFAMRALHGGDEVAPLDEDAVLEKYGYGNASLLCEMCFADLCTTKK